jgi:hypothetical protein
MGACLGGGASVGLRYVLSVIYTASQGLCVGFLLPYKTINKKSGEIRV